MSRLKLPSLGGRPRRKDTRPHSQDFPTVRPVKKRPVGLRVKNLV